jgi:hypothetical protein
VDFGEGDAPTLFLEIKIEGGLDLEVKPLLKETLLLT